ncbi:hypothetical protein RIF29_07579 [Crotalaria pallida]|uniref:RNase H type-1 domain-containing protein n=1 Tax=Crotalaria pallida TaxID=3830 RepID=A0AAN9J4H2_CROPI
MQVDRVKAAYGFSPNCKIRSISTQFIHWRKPPEGWFKMNTDGTSRGNPGLAGCGGLIRDGEGRWIIGYARRIGVTTAYKAELWGILTGMQVAWNDGIRNIIIESDSLTIVNLMNKENSHEGPSSYNSLISHINMWRRKAWNINFSHTMREGNECADFLANFSLHLNEETHIFDQPLDGIRSLLSLDYAGIALPRDIYCFNVVCFLFFVFGLRPLGVTKKKNKRKTCNIT